RAGGLKIGNGPGSPRRPRPRDRPGGAAGPPALPPPPGAPRRGAGGRSPKMGLSYGPDPALDGSGPVPMPAITPFPPATHRPAPFGPRSTPDTAPPPRLRPWPAPRPPGLPAARPRPPDRPRRP